MVSAKPRPGKISPKKLMPGQKSAQKPNDQASFHELQSAKIGNFQQVGHFLSNVTVSLTHFLSKSAKTLMPRQNLPPKT